MHYPSTNNHNTTTIIVHSVHWNILKRLPSSMLYSLLWSGLDAIINKHNLMLNLYQTQIYYKLGKTHLTWQNMTWMIWMTWPSFSPGGYALMADSGEFLMIFQEIYVHTFGLKWIGAELEKKVLEWLWHPQVHIINRQAFYMKPK